MSLLDKLKRWFRRPITGCVYREYGCKDMDTHIQHDQAWVLSQLDEHGLSWNSHPLLEPYEKAFFWGLLDRKNLEEVLRTVLADLARYEEWNRRVDNTIAEVHLSFGSQVMKPVDIGFSSYVEFQNPDPIRPIETTADSTDTSAAKDDHDS